MTEYNDNSTQEIMPYLIKKLQSNYSLILKYNNLIDSSESPETFFSLRKDLKLLFNDLTENLKQGIFAIKALTNQNKKILEEMKLKDFENKEITEQINNIHNENKKLKTQIIKIKDKDIEDNLDKNEDYNYKEDEFNNLKKGKIINKNKEINNNYNNINNEYEFAQLSNIKNIIDNKKKNKMKLKMAFEQHFTNNQDQDMNDFNNINNNNNY